MLTVEQALLLFSYFAKRRAFFDKVCFGGPEALFTAELVAAGVFFVEEGHAFLN